MIKFQVGDIVTRDGTDRQKIIEIYDDDLIEVECIREPLGWRLEDGSRGPPWCKIGERETNLARRYEFPADMLVDSEVLPVAVLAGSRKQFDELIRQHGESARRMVYIDCPERLYGSHFSGVERIGTWFQRRDASELEALALSRVRAKSVPPFSRPRSSGTAAPKNPDKSKP